MPSGPWSREEDAELQAFKSQGLSHSDIAKNLGRTQGGVEKRLRRLRDRQVNAQVGQEVANFKESANETKIKQLEQKVESLQSVRSASGVVPDYQDEWDGATEWAKAEEDSGRRIERAVKFGNFSATYPEGPIAVVAVSDQHIAPGTPCDFRRMREDAEIIRDTPGFYAVLAGDGVDNHIKIRPAMLAARSQPDDQWRLYEHYLEIFAEKILVMISGNHDAWADQFAGVDMVRRIAERQKLAYCPAEARLTVTVGKVQYRIAIRHQYRFGSSFNQTHTVKRWYEMGAEPFDIGVIGHHHEHSIEECIRHSRRIYVCRPGSYQVTSAYSRQFGFASAIPTCPTFILFPGQRRIIGFGDVRDALTAWNGLKNGAE